jgi:signal peptidase I
MAGDADWRSDLESMNPWLPFGAIVLALSPLAVVHPVRISGHSMEPALRDGTLHVALRAWATHAPRRGEAWIVEGPEGPSAKRVIGLPGETLEQLRGDIRINGRFLEEPYVAAAEREDGGPWSCGRGFFVLGDNRPQSQDGRFWGPLPREAFSDRILGHSQ